MINKNNPTGAKIIGTLSSSMFNAKSNKYIVLDTDPTPLGLGDLVISVNGTTDLGLPVCTKASNTGKVRGIVVGFVEDYNYLNQNYRSANTRRIALVNDDPQVMFEMQVNGELLSTHIGNIFDTTTGSLIPTTGQSTTQIDLISSSTTSQIKILYSVQSVTNTVGLYARVICCFMEHELSPNAAGGTSTNYWARNSGASTLYPSISVNDNIDIGTGLISCGSLKIGTLSGILKSIAGIIGVSATTDDLTEGATNLYFTEVKVLSTELDALYVASAGVLAVGDELQDAIAKLDGNVSLKLGTTLADGKVFIGNVSNVATGVSINGQAIISNTGTVTLDNAAVIAKKITGFSSGAGSLSANDTLLSAIQKLDGNINAIGTGLFSVAAGVISPITATNDLTIGINRFIHDEGIVIDANGGEAGFGSTFNLNDPNGTFGVFGATPWVQAPFHAAVPDTATSGGYGFSTADKFTDTITLLQQLRVMAIAFGFMAPS